MYLSLSVHPITDGYGYHNVVKILQQLELMFDLYIAIELVHVKRASLRKIPYFQKEHGSRPFVTTYSIK